MSMRFTKGDTVSLKSAVSCLSSSPEDLCDEDLVLAVEKMATSNHNLTVENMVLECYLEKVDPDAAVGLQQLLDHAAASAAIHSRIQAATATLVHGGVSSASLRDYPSDRTSPNPSGTAQSVVKYGTVPEKGPRINVIQKVEMVEKLTDETRYDLEKLRVNSQRSRINIHAQVEESRLMLQELKSSEEALEARVMRGVDKRTGRIPAEKFVRHMEDWFIKANFTIEKLRLMTSTLKSKFIRVQQQLVEKEELGERIHPVDFIQLENDNKCLIQKLDEKNLELMELKKVTGKSSLMLSNHKNQLMQQLNKLAELRETVIEREDQIEALADEGDKVDIELEKANDKYEAMKEMKSKYTVPDVLDYVKTKAELHELNKTVKVWTRRKNIQQSALTAHHATLRRIADEQRKDRTENATINGLKLSKANSSKHRK